MLPRRRGAKAHPGGEGVRKVHVCVRRAERSTRAPGRSRVLLIVGPIPSRAAVAAQCGRGTAGERLPKQRLRFTCCVPDAAPSHIVTRIHNVSVMNAHTHDTHTTHTDSRGARCASNCR